MFKLRQLMIRMCRFFFIPRTAFFSYKNNTVPGWWRVDRQLLTPLLLVCPDEAQQGEQPVQAL